MMTSQRLSDPATVELRNIGRGSAGSVFEIPGHELAYKKGSDETAMRNDAKIGKLAYSAFLDAQRGRSAELSGRYVPWVPEYHDFFPSNNKATDPLSWWMLNAGRFPEEDQHKPGSVILLDRILPMPEPVRHKLINTFFVGKENQAEAMRDPENNDCLTRVYLGRLSTDADAETPNSLRNFPLYLDNLQTMGLKKFDLAEEMARGLAVLHWGVGTDAMDVEFVLGSTSVTQEPRWLNDRRRRGGRNNFKRRTTHMWMFDYDKCSLFKEYDHSAAHRMVIACTGNDPYFPHPCVDEDLWRRFKEVYLQESQTILKRRKLFEAVNLPKVVMSKWEEWGSEDQHFKNDFDPFDRSGSDGGSENDDDNETGEDGDSDESDDTDDEEGDTDDSDEEEDDDETDDEDDKGEEAGGSSLDKGEYSDNG